MSLVLSRAVALFAVAIVAAAGGCSSSPPISVTLSPSSAQTIDQGQTVGLTATVNNDTSNQGVSWSLKGPGSLSSSTGPTVTYNPPPTNLSSGQQVTVTATSAADQTKGASVQITVNPFLQIPFQTLASGSVGTLYSQTIALTGGTPPFQWSVYNGPIITGSSVGGAVPDGLTLNASTGAITGTPTGGGTWYFEATVTDATGATQDNGFLSIQINPTAPPGNPVPFLNQPLVPTSASSGGPGFTISVSGTGFVSGATVNFNRAPLTTTFVDNEHLTAMVPAVDVATAGTAAVTVVNPSPGGGTSNLAYFTIGTPEATVTFANAANSPISIYLPQAIAVGDFNEDGKPDLVVAANVRLYVLLGNGDGTFAPASRSPMPVPSPPYDDFPSPYVSAIVTGDFKHSGHLGLAVGLFQNEAAAILTGNGDGTFAYADTLAYTNGQPTTSLTAGDFNADGNLDLFAANSLNGVTLLTLLGYGYGAFNGIGQSFQIPAISSAAGDFNGDGKLDLVIDGSNILLGNGDGTFNQAASPAAGKGAYAAAVGDFNGDGKLDLAVTDAAANTVTILLGNGDGTFTPARGSPIPVGNEPESILAADFNNDGKLDLALANFSDNTITLLLGNGDGTFTPASGSPYAVGKGPFSITAADFNGDGKLDLAVANSTDGTVSILLQQ